MIVSDDRVLRDSSKVPPRGLLGCMLRVEEAYLLKDGADCSGLCGSG